MELSKKTTILFPPDLHEQLARRAEQEGTSLGELVRRACRDAYSLWPPEKRLDAVRELAELELPVGDPAAMKRESVPQPGDLAPRDP